MATKKKPEALDFSGEAGAGFENVTQDDLGIPFLKILQKLSPEVDETSSVYIDDAKAGMIINSASKEIYGGSGEPVQFVPCGYQKVYVEWTPRESGGGFVKTHGSIAILEQTTRNDRFQDVLENGNLIVTTAYMFGIVITDDGEPVKAVISFTSTQLKKARQWLSSMRSIKIDGKDGKFTPPMYSHKYNLSSVPESNDSGNWYGWKIENAGLLEPGDADLLGMARESSKEVTSGRTGLALNPAPTEDGDNVPF